jgi:hypothetical protein
VYYYVKAMRIIAENAGKSPSDLYSATAVPHEAIVACRVDLPGDRQLIQYNLRHSKGLRIVQRPAGRGCQWPVATRAMSVR